MSTLKKLFDPRYTQTLVRKIRMRLKDKKAAIGQEAYRAWLDERGVAFEEWGRAQDAALYEESLAFAETLYARAKERLETVPFFMGGGALCPILYFLIRRRNPHITIET